MYLKGNHLVIESAVLPTSLPPNQLIVLKNIPANLIELYETDSSGNAFPLKTSQNFKTIEYSGRQYMRLNTFCGFSNAYGFSYYQFNQQMGTGVSPSITHSRNGILMYKDSVIENIYMNGYHNNAEAFVGEIFVTCFETKDNTTATNIVWEKSFEYKTSNTNARKFKIEVNEKCPQGSEIIVCFRKKTGSATIRYFYNTVTIGVIEL